MTTVSMIAQTAMDSTAGGGFPEWAAGVDGFAKLTASLVAAVVAVLGIPVAYLQTQKTRAEIRKLELEAADLAQKTGTVGTLPTGHRISIESIVDSRVNIQFVTDPRFLGPLLVLLDFVVVWVLLTIASYGFAVLPIGFLADVALVVIAAVLLIPVLRNALRLRSSLRAADPDGADPDTIGEKRAESAA